MIENLFLSVGAMKAGTTWLYEQLANHPEIHFSPEKEIHYFANVAGIENQLNHRNRLLKLKSTMEKLGKGNPTFILKHLDEIEWYLKYAYPEHIDNLWYEQLFSSNSKKYCADFSNLYCQIDQEGWKNVRKVARNIKVIYTLRNPLDRIWSHYKFHLKWIGKEDKVITMGFDEFKQTIDKEGFWKNAKYSENYKRLNASLNSDELMLLYFEDFRKNPVSMLNAICEFLKIPPIELPTETLTKRVNETKSFDFPEDWKAYAISKLAPEINSMKESGIWRDSWAANNN